MQYYSLTRNFSQGNHVVAANTISVSFVHGFCCVPLYNP